MSAVVVALVTDMIFSSKISSTANSVAASLKIVASAVDLESQLNHEKVQLVLIDLGLDQPDPIEAIRLCKRVSPATHVIGFVSHVQCDLITKARDAGADEVLARSAFVTKLPTLLSAAANLPVQENTPRQTNRASS